jgi:chromosome segregation ATPase
VDRFILRDTSGRMTTIKEQQDAVDRTKAKLVAQEARLVVQKYKQAKELNDKLLRELKEAEGQASDAQRALDNAAAERARIKAEIEKNKTPPDDAR